jgi:hypothetical protein
LLIITNILVFCEGLLGVDDLKSSKLFEEVNIKHLQTINKSIKHLTNLISESLSGRDEKIIDYKL